MPRPGKLSIGTAWSNQESKRVVTFGLEDMDPESKNSLHFDFTTEQTQQLITLLQNAIVEAELLGDVKYPAVSS